MSRSVTTDIDRGVVDSEAQASRVAEASNALIAVLLTDERVRGAYDEWRRRMESEGIPRNPQAILQGLKADIAQLVALRDRLGLAYRWLPQSLLWEFCRLSAGGSEPWGAIDVPSGLPWASRGRYHARKTARNVGWFYRHKIKQPADSIVTLADEYARAAGRVTDARSVVQDGIRDAEMLLACIS